MNLGPFQGGRRLGLASAGVGLLGLALTAIGAAVNLQRTLLSYLAAFTFWLGIALGVLILLMILHAARARWPVVLRRILEVIGLSLPLFLVLFIPIALGMGRIFPWVNPTGQEPEVQRLWEHRRLYLNVPFFLIRAAVYFGVWIVLGSLLHAWSVRQDRTRELEWTVRQRRLGAGGLPFLALTMSFAAFDWLMSLEAHLSSTIFGVYYFAGSFVAAIAVVILAATATRGQEELFGRYLNPNHWHSLGKLLFAFVAFWAYIAFSQFLLIWIANLPDEVPWYLVRNRNGWAPVAIALIVGHFIVPFFALISADVKKRPPVLAAVAVWVLVFHYLDLYWVLMPRVSRLAPSPSWTDLTALVGIGAVALAFTIWRMRGQATVPIGDPYLDDSLRYQPE